MRCLLISFMVSGALAGCGASDDPIESISPAESGTDEDDPVVDTSSGDTDSGDTDSGDTDSGDTDSGDDADLEPGDDATTDLVIEAVATAWGIDEVLARCVVEELSLDDPAAIDPAAVDDPTKEICGTSLVELMTGEGG